MIAGPSTGFEVFTPGRQGIRAKCDLNPTRGSADLFGTPSAVFPLFLAVAVRRRRVISSAAEAAGKTFMPRGTSMGAPGSFSRWFAQTTSAPAARPIHLPCRRRWNHFCKYSHTKPVVSSRINSERRL